MNLNHVFILKFKDKLAYLHPKSPFNGDIHIYIYDFYIPQVQGLMEIMVSCFQSNIELVFWKSTTTRHCLW